LSFLNVYPKLLESFPRKTIFKGLEPCLLFCS
jgi:hypothetical protein